MEISEAKRYVRLREWAAMIQACKASGQNIKDWCKENGICTKTYYYRLKSVRLAALQEPEKVYGYYPEGGGSQPVFAELPFGAANEKMKALEPNAMDVCAVTVRMGEMLIDINNGADPGVIAQTLRIMREIC